MKITDRIARLEVQDGLKVERIDTIIITNPDGVGSPCSGSPTGVGRTQSTTRCRVWVIQITRRQWQIFENPLTPAIIYWSVA